MNTTAALKRQLGKVAAALDENLSDREMDQLLAERGDEIEALLEEAREDERRGNEAPLEPLHKFLLRARKQAVQNP
jgi:phage tail tape-measure protein